MKKLTRMPSIPKVVGVCKIEDNKELIGNRILLLDNIQDPGNLGTIIRSSFAFDVDTIILSERLFILLIPGFERSELIPFSNDWIIE